MIKTVLTALWLASAQQSGALAAETPEPAAPLPEGALGGALMQGRLNASGTRPYNRVMADFEKGYRGPVRLSYGREDMITAALVSGALDCALISQNGLRHLRDQGIDILDVGRIGTRRISLFRLQAGTAWPAAAALRPDAAAVLKGSALTLATGPTLPHNLTRLSAQDGLHALFDHSLSYFVAYDHSIEAALTNQDLREQLEKQPVPIATLSDHLVCRRRQANKHYVDFALDRYQSLVKSGWLSQALNM